MLLAVCGCSHGRISMAVTSATKSAHQRSIECRAAKMVNMIKMASENNIMHTSCEGAENDTVNPEDEMLFSHETLDRSSPELWPEQFPGLQELGHLPEDEVFSIKDPLLSFDDISLLHHYGTLTISALIMEVRKLYEKVYQLGLEEAKEITRGKYLDILDRRRK